MTQLTPREQEIIDLVCHGLLYKEIAHKLGMKHSTVQWHVHNIIMKANAKTLLHAIMIAKGIVKCDD